MYYVVSTNPQIYYCSRENTPLLKGSEHRTACTFLANSDAVFQILSFLFRKSGIYLIYKKFWLEAAVLYTVGHCGIEKKYPPVSC